MNMQTSFLQQPKHTLSFPFCCAFVSRCLVALRTMEIPPLLNCQSQSHIATDGQSVSKFWCQAPSGAHDQIFITLKVKVLFLLGAISNERTGLSFVHAAGPCQRSFSVLSSHIFLASGWSTLCNLGSDRKGITRFYTSVNVSYKSVSTGT